MGDILKGKVAVITGSGQGIGRAIAMGYARQGARIVTNNRAPKDKSKTKASFMLSDEERAGMSPKDREWVEKGEAKLSGDAESTARAIREMGGEAVSFFGDITDYESAGQLINTALDAYGKIDILVNVAGSFAMCPFEEMSPETFAKVTSVKLNGYFNTMRHAVPHMLAQGGGRIVNCTSRAYLGDVFKHAEYCAANAGVVGLTRATAKEYWDRNIMVNAFSPFAKTRAAYELELKEKYGDIIIGGAKAPTVDVTPEPETVVPLIVYLGSDQCKGVSGAVFEVAGSTVTRYSDPCTCAVLTKPGEWTDEEFMREVPKLLTEYRSIADLR